MSDTFDRGVSVPDLDDMTTIPEPGVGSMRLVGRESRLVGKLPGGAVVNLTSPSVLQDGTPISFSPLLLNFRGTVGVDATGDEVTLQLPLIQYYEATTDANGAWSITISGFTRVDSVIPVAIKNTTTLSEQAIATLHAYSNTAANGRVVESNTLAFLIGGGGDGLQYGEAGIRVRVRVEGI